MESIFKLGILLSVADRVSGPVSNMLGNFTALKSGAMSVGVVLDRFKTYGLIFSTMAAGVLAFLNGTAMATAPTQKALGELSSVGIENLAALEKAGQEFSGTWSGTTKTQFISAAYDIKSGISSLSDEGVAEFTKLAALTGKATKATTAEMTSLFATGYGIYKGMYEDLSDMQFGEVFSAGIAASVKNFKTTGSGMSEAISSLGATATSAQVPLEEQLSVLGMLQATMSGSEAGTKYKAMMQAAAGAGEKLNLQFLDSNNQLLSMPEILTTLRGKYGETLDAMEKMEIKKAFGTDEAVALIDLMYGKVGDLKTNINSLSTAMGQGTTFTEQMASAMNQDIGAGWALLAQRWHNLVEIAGKQLLPVMVPLFSWIGDLINSVIEFADAHEMIFQAAILFVGAAGSVIFVLGSLAAAFGATGLMLPSIQAGFGTMGTALAFLKTRTLSAIASTKAWILWQRQSFLTTLYVEGGLLAYAKTLATAPFRALKSIAVATWSHITALYAQFAASVAAAGGIKAFALSMGSGLLFSIIGAVKAVWAFNTALFANPITWVVMGIMALVAVLIILEKEFGVLSAAWDMFAYGMGFIAGTAMKTGKMIANAFMAPFRWIGRFIDKLGGVGPALKKLLKLVLSLAFPPLAIAFNWDAVKNGVTTAINWWKTKIPEWMASGKALMGAFTDGIKAKAMAPVETVKSGLAKLRNLLPFSDAKEGPLSTLTLSGARLMETIGAGMQATAPGLVKTMSSALAGVATVFNLAGPAQVQPKQIATPGKMVMESRQRPSLSPQAKAGIVNKPSTNQVSKKEIHIHLENINLPNVSDAQGLIDQIQRIAEGYDA